MTADRPLSVVLAGGGSAGHVAPLLAIAAALQQHSPEVRLLAVGTESGLETKLVPEAGLELALIERVPMPRRPNLDALRFPARMRKAVRESAALLKAADADVLLGVGGYVCTPMYSAARKASVPIVIHEANIKPGLANRWGARYTPWIGKTFEQTQLRQAQWVGMPIRQGIATLDRAAARQQARAALGLDAEAPVLLVTGGSLGAVRINKTLVDSLPALASAGVQVLHITGRGKAMLDSAGRLLSAEGYHQVEYVDAMEQAYAAADLMISRAGAGTVSEVAAIGLPAVFVPLPVGNGEQALNAATLTERDAALMVLDRDFTPEWLSARVLPLLQDRQRLAEISARAHRQGIRDAAEKMAAMIVQAAR